MVKGWYKILYVIIHFSKFYSGKRWNMVFIAFYHTMPAVAGTQKSSPVNKYVVSFVLHTVDSTTDIHSKF